MSEMTVIVLSVIAMFVIHDLIASKRQKEVMKRIDGLLSILDNPYGGLLQEIHFQGEELRSAIYWIGEPLVESAIVAKPIIRSAPGDDERNQRRPVRDRPKK
jgi:hypothetical protein